MLHHSLKIVCVYLCCWVLQLKVQKTLNGVVLPDPLDPKTLWSDKVKGDLIMLKPGLTASSRRCYANELLMGITGRPMFQGVGTEVCWPIDSMLLREPGTNNTPRQVIAAWELEEASTRVRK